jgi:hypothetical protein
MNQDNYGDYRVSDIFDDEDTHPETCPSCGMNHEKDVNRKEVSQERIRTYRRAIKMLCNGDQGLINRAMEDARNEIIGEIE